MGGPHVVTCFYRGRIVSASFHATEAGAKRRAILEARGVNPKHVEIKVYNFANLIQGHEAREEMAIAELERMFG